MAKDIVIQLQQLGDSTPHNQGRSTIYAAISEIERLRLEIEEQQYWNSVLKEQVKYII
jgi:hypothetical protein